MRSTNDPSVREFLPRTRMRDRLRELVRARRLIGYFAIRDFRLRYRQTLLGIGWTVLQPLGLGFVVWIFLGSRINLTSDSIPYSIYLYTGLTVWFFTFNTVNQAMTSTLSHAELIKKVAFPRLSLPFGAALSFLPDLLLLTGVGAGIVALHFGTLGWHLLILPFSLAMLLIFAAAIGAGLGALVVQFRDVRYAAPTLLQFLLFSSTILYDATGRLGILNAVVSFNPLSILADLYRASLIPGFQSSVSVVQLAALLVLSIGAITMFWRMEDSFADII